MQRMFLEPFSDFMPLLVNFDGGVSVHGGVSLSRGRTLSKGGGLCSEGLFPEGRQYLSSGALSGRVSVHGGPRRNMGPETETPWKEHGTRHTERKWHHTKTPCPPPNPGQNDWYTPVKILPCPKLRFLAAIIHSHRKQWNTKFAFVFSKCE